MSIASGTYEVPGSYMSNDNEDLSESKLRGDHLSDYRLMEQVKG